MWRESSIFAEFKGYAGWSMNMACFKRLKLHSLGPLDPLGWSWTYGKKKNTLQRVWNLIFYLWKVAMKESVSSFSHALRDGSYPCWQQCSAISQGSGNALEDWINGLILEPSFLPGCHQKTSNNTALRWPVSPTGNQALRYVNAGRHCIHLEEWNCQP